MRWVKSVFHTPSSNSCRRSTTSILEGLNSSPSLSTKVFCSLGYLLKVSRYLRTYLCWYSRYILEKAFYSSSRYGLCKFVNKASSSSDFGRHVLTKIFDMNGDIMTKSKAVEFWLWDHAAGAWWATFVSNSC
jgi:hypothetical protein